MRKIKIFLLSFAMLLVLSLLVACNQEKKENNKENENPTPAFVEKDYVSELKLDMNSNTKKAVVTVKTYIDGDTTHFNINESSFPGGNVLKARYLAINTPESTGQIEEWGKAASKFTRSKLENASSILLESNDENWNKDSTGSRYLVFVWYKENASSDWRNLNLEIIQNGYAKASNTAGNRYGETCINALNQAKEQKIKLYSEEKDPDFFYGEAQLTTIKNVRCNIDDYNGVKVAFDGVVTRNSSDGVYIEAYDEETEMYFGMYAYYGKGATSEISSTLSIGNYVRVVGSISEFNGTYQISGLEYKENNENTTKILDDKKLAGFECDDSEEQVYFYQPYTLISAEDFLTKKVSIDFTVETDAGEQTTTKEFDYKETLLNTTVKMNDLVVESIYTTTSDNDSSDGAMTLTCKINGKTIKVRTVVLKDSNGNTITESSYAGKTINVKGIVDCFNGEYQIKILSARDITIVG